MSIKVNSARKLLRDELRNNSKILDALLALQLRGNLEGFGYRLNADSAVSFKSKPTLGEFSADYRIKHSDKHSEDFTFADVGQFNTDILKLFPGLPGWEHFNSLPAFIKNNALLWMRFFEELDERYVYVLDRIPGTAVFEDYALFYLPDITPYSVNENSKGIFILVTAPFIEGGEIGKYFDFVQDLKSRNMFVGFELPGTVQDEYHMGNIDWLEGNVILAECNNDIYITDKQLLSLKMERNCSINQHHYCDRLKLPLNAIKNSITWIHQNPVRAFKQ